MARASDGCLSSPYLSEGEQQLLGDMSRHRINGHWVVDELPVPLCQFVNEKSNCQGLSGHLLRTSHNNVHTLLNVGKQRYLYK